MGIPPDMSRMLMPSCIERRPDAVRTVPEAAGRSLRIVRRALLEEVGVFHTVEDLDQSGQRVWLDPTWPGFRLLEMAVEAGKPELREAPVGDVADVVADVLGVMPWTRPSSKAS